MPKLRDVCRYVRSKNAGPFWMTLEAFMPDEQVLKHGVDSFVFLAVQFRVFVK